MLYQHTAQIFYFLLWGDYMAYLEFYKDAACSELWTAVPVVEIPYTTIYGNAITVEGFSVRDGTVLSGTDVIKSNPFLTYNRMVDIQRYYCKNGYSLEFGMSSANSVFRNYMYNNHYLSFSDQSAINDENNHPRYWAIGFVADGKHYIGFTRVLYVNYFPDYLTVSSAFEDSFWTSALRPPYDYGTGTDSDGGQGSGKIPHTDIPLTATPSKIVPIGGRGLHAYKINAQAYGSLQGYLWGDSSTLAKSLWQKFNNKTHNPVSCIVGCFSLPADFMPTGSGNTGINLAGLYLSPISGTCVSVGGNIGFVDKTITFGAIEPPFHNFLDYTAITCKIHVPFCGEMAIAPEQIIGSDLTLRYRVDQLNGNIVAAVKANGIVLGELSGNCAYNIPLTGGDDGTLQRLGAITSGVTAVVQDNVQGAMVAMQNGMNAGFSAQIINSDLHGSTTACENRVPYLVWTYSGTAYTPDYAQAQGVPCEFSGNLAAFSGGYGEFEIMSNSPALQLVYDVMGATETEKQEIAALLRNGVIV